MTQENLPIGKSIMIALLYPHIGIIMVIGYVCNFIADFLGIFHRLFLGMVRKACSKASEKVDKGNLNISIIMVVGDVCLFIADFIGVFYHPFSNIATKALSKAAEKIDKEVPKEY